MTVNALHSEAVAIKLLREGFGVGGISVKQVADTSVYLAFSDDVKNIKGEYLLIKKSQRPHPLQIIRN